MRVHKASDYDKIGFLGDQEQQKKEQKKAGKQRRGFETTQPKKFDEIGTTGSMHRSSVMSAGRSAIADNSATPVHRSNQTQNSILNPNRLEELSQQPRSDEQSKAIKAEQKAMHNRQGSQLVDEMIKSLKGVDTRKASSVSALSSSVEPDRRKSPTRAVSMFGDNKDFETVPDKTAGEKIVDSNKQRRGQKDDSWKKLSRPVTANSLTERFLEQLVKKQEEK